MGSFRALSLAGVIALGAVGPAAAADLLPPAPPLEAPVMSVDTSGWYLRGDVGVGVNQMSGLRSTFAATDLAGNPTVIPPLSRVATSIGDSAVIDIGVGYQINNWFRTDLTFGYHSATNYRTGYAMPPCNPFQLYCVDFYGAQISSFHGLVNGYVDLGTWAGVTPFIGAGVGFANLKMSGLTDTGQGAGVAADVTRLNFAWALMAGVGYSITPNLKVEMGYRYLNQGKLLSNPIICNVAAGCSLEQHSLNLASHDFRLGFRYMIGDAGPAPVMVSRPGPLIRKY
jgi:opacity protein-like surface antigen